MRLASSYLKLPKDFYEMVGPEEVPRASYFYWNQDLANKLEIDDSEKSDFLSFLAGTKPKLFESFAQSYAGHQFGYFNILGDGRALVLGEYQGEHQSIFDLQLKGSGATPFSRNGDGKAALGPMLRELIVSEAMAGLGIPTTRSLAVLLTGELIQRKYFDPGAILIRKAASHLRVGTFQWAKFRETQMGQQGFVRELADYAIERHFPSLLESRRESSEKNDGRYFVFFRRVVESQAKLMAQWMLAGFIHGVMNTDNMTISGETIDYGPCAFMDNYDPNTVFSSIDQQGRYRFGRQPAMAQWNLARFAETLLDHFHPDPEMAVKMAETELMSFPQLFQQFYEQGLRKKLGFVTVRNEDSQIFEALLQQMHQNKLDYSLTFLGLARGEETIPEWSRQWRDRIQQESRTPFEAQQMMLKENPRIIARNYWVEHYIEQTTKTRQLGELEGFLTALKNPFSPELENSPWISSPELENYKTYCGT